MMNYEIGDIVVLKSGKIVYIMDYDEKTKKYKGVDTEDNDPQRQICFSKSSVMMKV